VTGSADRCCVICGASLTGRRADAGVCGPPCRAERGRLRAILSGSDEATYPSVQDRLDRAQRRTSGLYRDADAR
jgi:hypothetical protein